MTPTHTETAEWLDGTLDLLRTKGWIQNAPVDKFGAHCLIGALQRQQWLRHLTGRDPQRDLPVVLTAEHAVLRQLYDHRTDTASIVNWNDQGSRTFDQVEKLLLDAADAERKAAAEAGEL
jgi:hypothetical protein